MILRAYILPRIFCHNISPGIVLLTNCRYMLFRAGVPRHAIIKKFGGESISGLEDLISVLSKLARGSRVPLEYISYMDRHRKKVLFFPIFLLESFERLPGVCCSNEGYHLAKNVCHVLYLITKLYRLDHLPTIIKEFLHQLTSKWQMSLTSQFIVVGPTTSQQ